HRPPGAVSVADRSAESHLVYGPRCFCPMVTRSRQLPPRTFLFWELLPKCCHVHSTTHGTGPSRKLSGIPYPRPRIVLRILAGTSGDVAAGIHVKPPRMAAGTLSARRSQDAELCGRNRAPWHT